MKVVMISEIECETENHMLAFLYTLKTTNGFENLNIDKLIIN